MSDRQAAAVLSGVLFVLLLLALARIHRLENGSAFTEIARQRDVCDTERADAVEKVYRLEHK